MAKPTKGPFNMVPKAQGAAPAELALKETKPRRAFTVERVEGGWRFVTFTYATDAAGDRIVSVTRTEPDLKAITIEALKIAVFNYWTKGCD